MIMVMMTMTIVCLGLRHRQAGLLTPMRMTLNDLECPIILKCAQRMHALRT